MAGEQQTPMMKQYFRIKRELPQGAILMFRLGDFFEMFMEDAETASPILGAVLTKRNGMPMCGVPFHALDAYLAKLIRAGKTVAICEQVEDPKTAKGVVRREVTRIVTPGTVTEENLLNAQSGNYIAAANGTSLAMLELSTGEFTVEDFDSEAKMRDALVRAAPAETLVPKNDDDLMPENKVHDFKIQLGLNITLGESWTFSPDAAADTLMRHFKVAGLDGFGLENKPSLVSAAGALLYYVSTVLRHDVSHVRTVRIRHSSDYLVIDAATVKHLLLVPGAGDTPRQATLLGVLDATRTPMGARLLKEWILRPLGQAKAINARLDKVESFVRNRTLLGAVSGCLAGIRDMARMTGRVSTGRANARDLRALAESLRPAAALKEAVLDSGEDTLSPLASQIDPEFELVSLVDRAIVDEPPNDTKDGGFTRAGFSAELDETRQAAQSGHEALLEVQAREIERTGIKTLKVKYNNILGYYIEIAKGSASSAPDSYIRRQTLTNCERFTTPELKEFEKKVLGAKERAIELEMEIFNSIVEAFRNRIDSLQTTSAAIAQIDVLQSLADRALAFGYVRPVIDESSVLEITDGRHPIAEQLPDAEPFVPNSTKLDCDECQIALITGPNAAGKSTYIRQVSTIAAMAHAGSFVPAASARIGVLDRIFTRIGAGDDLARGRSTFLVEMQETANILNNATARSLIVLDEIGRGTSTFDGISIAWSVVEYLHENPAVKAKTLFATHYHELTDLEDRFKGVKNYTVLVKEEGKRVVFLRRIVRGSAEKSFGIHVAGMAGLPPPVIDRASRILEHLEANELDIDSGKIVRRPRKRLSEIPGQLEMF